MDCYTCKYRREIVGDAHSQCAHPNMGGEPPNNFIGWLAFEKGYNPLKISMNEHGVRNGWCTYPINFDPIWIDNCIGYYPINRSNDETNRKS